MVYLFLSNIIPEGGLLDHTFEDPVQFFIVVVPVHSPTSNGQGSLSPHCWQRTRLVESRLVKTCDFYGLGCSLVAPDSGRCSLGSQPHYFNSMDPCQVA